MKQQILISNVPLACFVLSSVGMTFCIPEEMFIAYYKPRYLWNNVENSASYMQQ